jgi:hypothetical protein
MTIGAAFDNTLSFAGYIDAFRFLPAATNTTTETPAAVAPAIGDHMVNWFDIPSMKLWEATAASAVAGTNPTFTVRSRLFLGEADTSAVAVTAVRNYALKGEYVSALTTPLIGVSASATINHNLGIRPRDIDLTVINLTSEVGYTPGDDLRLLDTGNTTWNSTHKIRSDRNSSSFATQATSAFAVGPKTGGNAVIITAANWGYRLIAKRGW